jgi:hypothetical protein
VARVETQLSFANQLVGLLTLGIYTPMDIRVTCAASRSDAPAVGPQRFGIRPDAPQALYAVVFTAAAHATVTSGAPAFVVFAQPVQGLPEHD